MGYKKPLKEWILGQARKKTALSAPKLATDYGISRQNMTKALREMVHSGHLHKEGATKNAVYKLKNKTLVTSPSQSVSLKLVKKLKGLEEDRVFSEVALRLNLKRLLSSSAFQSFNYAFTEMLNNAIDHSASKRVTIHVDVGPKASFEIRDEGVGIFYNLQKKFNLEDEFQGLEHLLKGKQTTDPTRHSGQGVFFTSRIADNYRIRSHKISLRVDNKLQDTFVGDERFIKGTTVFFEINAKSRKVLRDLFNNYSDSDFEFSKGEVKVKLSTHNSLLSRSEAKRLLWGLEKYKKIVFIFSGVKSVGQAFADEIFRVFANKYPKIELVPQNASESVRFMIERAQGEN